MIKETNKVDVFFENVDAEFNVTVKYKPQVGEQSYWLVQREDGTEVLLQNFTKMVKCT